MAALGIEKAKDVKAYREAIIELRKQGVSQGDARIKLLEKRIEESIRHNQATEKQAATNEAGRNSRAANTQAGINSRAATTQSRLAAQNKAQAASVIASLRNKGASEEDIQNYINSLPAELRP
jgi:hypothetical protein